MHASDLLDAFAKTPRLAVATLWAASRDEAMVVEHLVGVGRRDAAERMAHFLLELGVRLALVGMGTKAGFACPLSQYLLADASEAGCHLAFVIDQVRHTPARETGSDANREGKPSITFPAPYGVY